MMDVLGISLAVMAVISVAIFEFAREGGVAVSMEGGRIRAFKGEEYEIVLVIESRATDWMDATSPTARVETGQLMKTEPLGGGGCGSGSSGRTPGGRRVSRSRYRSPTR